MSLKDIVDVLNSKDSFVLCIDGYAGSFKTTLAHLLSKELNASLIHMDHFYVPIKKRSIDWFEKPAGNIDFKRLEEEIIKPYINKKDLIHNEFNPQKQELIHFDKIPFNQRLIIEGSYSMHPNISIRTASLFLKCDSVTQKKRLKEREKDNFDNFKNIWIKKEFNYHKALNVEKSADWIIDTSNIDSIQTLIGNDIKLQ